MDNKVSVLITFYNQSKYVDRCLESVFTQKTDFDFIVLIGDDGSDDDTVDKIRKWTERFADRIRLFIRDRNKGIEYNGSVRASRNRVGLVREVRTPYFIMLDGDDYWTDPEKLQKQYDVLEDPRNKACSVCNHRMLVKNEENSQEAYTIPTAKIKSGIIDKKLYWKSIICGPMTNMYRSEFISRLRWDYLEDFFHDWIILFSFIQFGNIYYLNDCMSVYNINENGIWSGEQRCVSIVRSMMSYDLEMIICPSMEKEIKERHITDFRFFCKYANLFSGVDRFYLNLAHEKGLVLTERVLKNRQLFFRFLWMDRLYVFLLRIRRFVEHGFIT